MKLTRKGTRVTRLALTTAALVLFSVAFLVAPVEAATSYNYGSTFYPVRTSVDTNLGSSSRDVAGGEIALAFRQTGYGYDSAERHYYIRMALEGLAPSAPDGGPTGNGWDYPNGKNVFYTYAISSVKFKIKADVSGNRANTRGEINTIPTSQTNNERLEVVNSGQTQAAWSGSTTLFNLANTAMGVVTSGYWFPISIATTLLSTCYSTMDTRWGEEEWWWWWADDQAQIFWDYGYGNLFYSKQPWPEQVNAITWFWWHVPISSGTYKIRVTAEIAYGHYWVNAYGRWAIQVDGYISTYNYLKVIH